MEQFLSDLKENPGRWASRAAFFLGPWCALWMVEILNENDVFSDLHLWQVGMNLIWYYAVFLLARLALGRLRRAAAAAAVLFYVLGLVNHFVLRFRGRILFPADVTGWETAANVADSFDFTPDGYMVQGTVLLISYLFFLWICPPQKKREPLPKRLVALMLAGGIGYGYAFFATGMLPALGIYTQQWVTQANGFVLNFTVALRYSSVDKPQGYSRQAALSLLEEYTQPVENTAFAWAQVETTPTNLVVIMNESFADFAPFHNLETSEDPTPFLHSLQENTVKGVLYSPVTGGGTASVEFEYLTGFSTLFQPPHTVAYQLYVEEGMPSLAALAAAEGYQTTAFHPYKSSGWNRPVAYRRLGFAGQLYDGDVTNRHMVRRYISDQSDYREMFRITGEARESGHPAFLFNVTMQNHSGYAQGWTNLTRSISLPESLRSADSTAEQYFALLRESDRALEELIDHYSQVEEPTMIVFFGDHQPPLKNAFYQALYGKSLSQRTTEEVMQQYAVPFFIWTNYEIQAREDVVLSPNYLGILTAKMAGLPLTPYMRFLEELYRHLPVITPVGYIDDQGNYLDTDALTPLQQDWLWRYEMLNYCGMVDLFPEARALYCG